MTIEQKVGKTLAELGAQDRTRIHDLFDEVHKKLAEQMEALKEAGAADEDDRGRKCKALRDRWLARKNGLLAQIDEHWLKASPKDYRAIVGAQFNSLRKAAAPLEFDELVQRVPIKASVSEDLLRSTHARPDLTFPGVHRPLGSVHPVTRVQREIEDIFLGLGFTIETGPEIESVYYNFDALNIPENHPSRDDFDTIYVDSKTLLRTHTSPVQIRAMQKYARAVQAGGRDDGLYIVIPGKCYRHDNPDATHSPMFHQVEGLAVDKDITFADLKGTLDFFAKKFFGERTRTSFHPSFFPFTEPSGEVAVSCFVCDGRGCRTCKESGWIEVMGCGMVHPQVLRNGGLDPERYSGWAFGLGIDRFAMIKYDINDIQHFFQSDVRFLEQFQ